MRSPESPDAAAPKRERSTGLPRSSAPFELKGNSYNLVVLKPLAPDDDRFFPELEKRIQQAPSFFQSAPVVLDLDEVEGRPGFSLPDFAAEVRAHGLIPTAVQGGGPELHAIAAKAGLGLVTSTKSGRAGASARGANVTSSNRQTVEAKPAEASDEAEPSTRAEPPRTSLVITEPVRSGRQIYAPRGDLVVLAPVSAGAELLADGCIHVYGALRGRALAGMHGDTSARIFCQSLEAELVSIAGLYRVSEDMDPAVFKKPAQVFQEGEALRIEPLS